LVFNPQKCDYTFGDWYKASIGCITAISEQALFCKACSLILKTKLAMPVWSLKLAMKINDTKNKFLR
jgi:hypothetical protein